MLLFMIIFIGIIGIEMFIYFKIRVHFLTKAIVYNVKAQEMIDESKEFANHIKQNIEQYDNAYIKRCAEAIIMRNIMIDETIKQSEKYYAVANKINIPFVNICISNVMTLFGHNTEEDEFYE